MKLTLTFLMILLSLQVVARSFPTSPHSRLTPGSLCTTPDRFRYPENIAYCEREVSSSLKQTVFTTYRELLGYVLPGDRMDYKVDHFIPLCAGGSNNQDNLWPQHISISRLTDRLESLGCEKLARGLITQKELIDLISLAKMNTTNAPYVHDQLQKLR